MLREWDRHCLLGISQGKTRSQEEEEIHQQYPEKDNADCQGTLKVYKHGFYLLTSMFSLSNGTSYYDSCDLCKHYDSSETMEQTNQFLRQGRLNPHTNSSPSSFEEKGLSYYSLPYIMRDL
jgi:hypothetical protein